MPTLLQSPSVCLVLHRLFAAAAHDAENDVSGAAARPLAGASPQERADAAGAIYMPISQPGGLLLYELVRASRPQTVVEFGTSFGISTVYLAAAVADSGSGGVLTTELNASKAERARANLAEAGLAEHVTILRGDARETLAEVPGPIGFVFLDGWKDLCLPVLLLLEPRLAPGALVVADDSSFASMSDYLAYVREPGNGYVSVSFPVEDGMELSCFARSSG